jgi:hypothetical protein
VELRVEVTTQSTGLLSTLPFTQAEMVKVLAAFDMYRKQAGVANAQRLKPFVL